MRKNFLFYLIAFSLLLSILLFFNKAYQELINYSELTNRTNAVYSSFQNISKQVNNAAILNPDLLKASDSLKGEKLFFTNSRLIIQQLDLLRSTVKDSVNITIAQKLDTKIRSELQWLLTSNVPDSIIHHRSSEHVAVFQEINLLINEGILRTNFLLEYRKNKLDGAINNVRIWMLVFISVSILLLLYTTLNLFRQKVITKRKESELDKSEKRFRKLVENSSDIIAMLDKDMYPLYRSPSAERLTGYTAEERKGGVQLDQIHADDMEAIKSCLAEINNNPGKVIPITYRIKHKDGHYIWLEGTFTNMFHDPDVKAIVVNMRDITNRKDSEEEVLEVYKEKETVLNRINDAVVSVDNEWRYTFLNDAAMVAHPMGRQEVLGKVIWDVHPQMKGTVFWDKYHEAMRTGKVVEIENYYAPMDIWFFVKVYPSPDGLTIFYKDISGSKKAEHEISQMLKEVTDYKLALDESSIVAITDQKGIIRHANDNFCKISKYSREELIGQDHRIINSGYHSKEFIRDLWTTIANGKIWSGDIKNKAKDGSTYWVETTIVPFLNEQGKPYQYVAIRADITQRKKTEEELSKNIQELERSNKELEQFAYIASHDLQEPLRMVGSYMQLIERRYKGKLDADADEFIHFAVDGANRMKQLIGDLLNYSRMNRAGVVATVNLNEVMNEVVHNLSASIKDSGGTVHYTEMPSIEADRTQMLQLFQNLISNALKFNKEGLNPQVDIKVEEQDTKWLFSITDNGIGIEQQYSDRIFIIFKQLHSKANYSGTGIGLAIAKKIVERHGGKIWFESETGKGTTFYFTLNK